MNSDFGPAQQAIGGTLGSYSTGSTTAPGRLAPNAGVSPVGAIPRAFSEAESLSEQVVQGIIALRDRLENGGVLVPSSPAGQADQNKTPRTAVSGIVSRLNDQRDRLMVASALLADIHQRIDL